MAKFAFPLEGVLRQRKSVEQERQRALAAVQAQMTQLQEELKGLDQTVQEALGDLRQNRLVGRIDMAFIAAHRRFTGAIQRKAMGLVQRMALVQREMDEKRSALAQAAKGRKIIEKLKEKQHQRWLEDQNRREVAQMDEIGMRISYRQMLEQADVDGGDA